MGVEFGPRISTQSRTQSLTGSCVEGCVVQMSEDQGSVDDG